MNPIEISIIIATRNREAILWVTVEKAVAAASNKLVEIIVVNDGDETLNPPKHVAAFARYFNNPSRGVSSARNFGAAQASGNILFFIDDDMWINGEVLDWIQQHTTEEPGCNAVYNINWQYPPQLQQQLRHTKIGRYLLHANYNCMWGRMHVSGKQPVKGLYSFSSIASCSLVMHKNIFRILGGYNEQLIFQGEDIDLSNRLRLASVPIYAVFDTTLFHNHQDRLEIDGFLSRLSNGYKSEFEAAKAGIIEPLSNREYGNGARLIFELALATEFILVGLYKIIPNHSSFMSLSNKVIGLLAGLTRYKKWRNVFLDRGK